MKMGSLHAAQGGTPAHSWTAHGRDASRFPVSEEKEGNSGVVSPEEFKAGLNRKQELHQDKSGSAHWRQKFFPDPRVSHEPLDTRPVGTLLTCGWLSTGKSSEE